MKKLGTRENVKRMKGDRESSGRKLER
ncbi:hypothetical protein L195_g024642, partial [Trifolium pratense]